MRRNGIAVAALAAAWAVAFVAAGQERPADEHSMDETARLLPTPAKLAIWTDRLGHLRRRDVVRVHLTVDPKEDRRVFREFVFLEHIQTGRRRYLERFGAGHELRDEIVDTFGRPPDVLDARRVSARPPTRIWGGRTLEPGLWQFVAELRSRDTTEVVKRAYAKFVVSARIPVVLGAGGRDTEIAADTTWTSDRIYAIRHQVFVNAGATLAIEPGTLVQARGPQASIIVERGGRILAKGRPDAPIVMTCDEAVGQRHEGCWGGLVVLGGAPATRGGGRAEGILPEARPAYGGDDPIDSSGALRYVRVEFAGAGSGSGLGFYGVGSGTAIDHVQSHASAGDGIRFVGGTANCMYCVSSGARAAGLAWAKGWQGIAQHMFLQQGPTGNGFAIKGDNHEPGFGASPRSSPKLYNVTVVGSSAAGSQAGAPAGAPAGAILLAGGSALTLRNTIAVGFLSAAIDVRDNSPALFIDGTSSIGNSILHGNGGEVRNGEVTGGVEAAVSYLDVEPTLINARYEANPDPRPRLGSPALRVGAGAVPPSDGMLDTSAQYVGAFGDLNWLEEWTFFGPESEYDTRETDDQGN